MARRFRPEHANGRPRRGPAPGLLRLALWSALLGVLAAVLVVPGAAVAAAQLADAEVRSSPPTSFETSPVPQESVMLAADGSTIARFSDENRTPVPLTQISPAMRQAIVSIEDARFFQHGAIDPRGLLRALNCGSRSASRRT